MAVRVRRPDAELALVELLNLAPAGVEEVDDEDGEWVEYALYGAPGELPDLPDLEASVGGSLVEVSTSEVPDDWGERWKHFHGPVEVAGRIWVRPPWSPEPEDRSLLDVVIDPGQAFGTGAHPTTKLCLRADVRAGAERPVRRPRMRLGGAGDRGGSARMVAGAGRGPRPGECRSGA